MLKYLPSLASAALGLLSVTATHASTWYTFSQTQTDTALYFFDLDTVVMQGDTLTIWVKYVNDPMNPDGDGSFATAQKYNFICSKRTLQVFTSATYDKAGKFIRAFPIVGKVKEATPGSIAEGLVTAVCAPDFPKNKSHDLYFQVRGNDILRHTADYFENQRAISTDPAPK